MPKFKIFVSGVQGEFKIERRGVKDFILEHPLLKEYFDVFLFEDASAKSKSSQNVYIKEVNKSDIYIGLLGDEYGKIIKDAMSATEIEFREAHKKNKEIFIYIKGNKDKSKDKRMRNLIKDIKNPETGYTYKRFNELQGLKNGVHESLIEFLRNKGIVGKTIFDKDICKDAKFSDIDEERIKWFLQRAKKQRNYALDINTPAKEVLTHLNLVNNSFLKNAAVLLFGKDPHKFYLQSEVKCLQFSGTEIEKPFASYHIYTNNLFEQIDKAISFVLDAIRLPVIPQERTAMVSRPSEIPSFVIQEAIVNAVAHRDYHSNGSVQVMVFIDRVEVWNPGKLPSQITIDSLKKPHTSYPNNPLLAEVLYLADYIQKAGSGTLEMIKQCKNSGLPEPEFFLEFENEFRIIISRDIFTEDFFAKMGLNERQIKAVKYVKGKGKIRNKEYQEICDVKKRQATDDLKELEEKKVLQRIGKTGKGTYYILKGRQRGEKGIKGAPKGRK